MDSNYLVLDSDNKIVNIVVWNGVAEFNPGEGLTLEAVPTDPEVYYNIGMYKHSDGTFQEVAE